jgi:hypothetical protein
VGTQSPTQAPNPQEEKLRSTKLIGAIIGVLALAFAAVAVASPQFTQKATVKLSSGKAGKSVGTTANLVARDPGAPNQKPAAAAKVVVKLPKGTVANNKAVTQCNLTKAQIESGDKKCPKSSKVGKGTAKANVAPLIASTTEDITVFNRKGGLIFYLTDNAKDPQPGQTFALFSKLSKKGVLTTNVPPLEPLPNTFAVLTDFKVTINKKSKGKGKKKINLLTAPKKCPKSKKFTSTVDFTYSDGSTKKGIKTTQACKK